MCVCGLFGMLSAVLGYRGVGGAFLLSALLCLGFPLFYRLYAQMVCLLGSCKLSFLGFVTASAALIALYALLCNSQFLHLDLLGFSTVHRQLNFAAVPAAVSKN